jgi:hypothetical protein
MLTITVRIKVHDYIRFKQKTLSLRVKKMRLIYATNSTVQNDDRAKKVYKMLGVTKSNQIDVIMELTIAGKNSEIVNTMYSICDLGATINVCGVNLVKHLGIEVNELPEYTKKIKAAIGEPIQTMGKFEAKLNDTDGETSTIIKVTVFAMNEKILLYISISIIKN